ncbi:uncharacterized protein BDW43DRAFT_306683 [Aspergillus alliaceus]|uniref:uncharacterized protein n=1 Tax=Petromyces alliaceus TaxID=209559 RepID=UPI0012A4AE55|nr:uncharacterized protein BDW43DRAFT_306683 [Aspergillus alliaceus]KAB8237977.1 hypothetical protein BDW43DRAFT_306683 [Aspergillus alliaceus]
MANPGVVLGLLPTVLSTLGSNTLDTAILARVTGRPFLSLCLALGPPAEVPDWPCEYPNVKALLNAQHRIQKRTIIPKYGRPRRILISALQYIIVFAAVTNIATACYELGVRCICKYATEVTAQPLIWAFVVGLIHIGGTIALTLRCSVIRSSQGHPDHDLTRPKRFSHWFHKYLLRELTPPLYSTSSLKVEPIQESYLFPLVSWCTSTETVVHILRGTMVLPSPSFISVEDALGTSGRFLASLFVVRLCWRMSLLSCGTGRDIWWRDKSGLSLPVMRASSAAA